MASGRKHASFRHRSQSDNGVIIELTPLSLGGRISPRLTPCLEASLRLPSCAAAARQLGCEGRCPPSLLEGCSRWHGHFCAPGSCVGPACGRSVVRCVWEQYLIEASWPFQSPACGRSGGGASVVWVVFREPGVSDAPVTAARGCEASERVRVSFLCVPCRLGGWIWKIHVFFPRACVETL